MGIVHRIDRRTETRREADLTVTVWGVDVKGDRFLQQARAREISLSGALLYGLDVELRSGDVLGLFYEGKTARYRVVWVRYANPEYKVQAAIHCMEPDACPWKEVLTEQRTRDQAVDNSVSPDQ